MNTADKIFQKYNPDFDKLEEYGFIKKGDTYTFEKLFFDNQFKLGIEINNKITTSVIDLESNDEFLPLKIENSEGAFVADVKAQYENILTDIRDKCFIKNYYIFPQSNRITHKIIQKYNNYPEFLWEKFDDIGIFRNPETNKWYAIIMDVDKSKIIKTQKGLIEVMNVKLNPEHVQELVKTPNFYTAYHMNKKYWISIILDNSVPDEKIMEFIEESHSFTVKNKKKN